jgi:hypothetical protein
MPCAVCLASSGGVKNQNATSQLFPFRSNYRNVTHISWLGCISNKGTNMLKIAALTSALVIGLVSSAYAQTASPAREQDKAGMTNTNSDAAKESGTTGMSNTQSKETGWSGISEKGPYDGPAPKTTTGPTGSGSKTESPEK